MATGPATVIAAVGAGKNAAAMIDRFVRGKARRVLPKAILPTVYVPPATDLDDSETITERVKSPELAAADRLHGFAEVELCIGEHAAVCEARRCMRCDLDFTRPD